MTMLPKYKGKMQVHKHRGNRWTVRIPSEVDDEVFDWLSHAFGEEDFESGPWALMQPAFRQSTGSYAIYDITDKSAVTMMLLKWA